MKTTNLSELEKTFGDRLLTLADGRAGIRGSLKTTVKEPSDAGDRPVLDFVASDETLDRYNEVINADGWNLDNYQRNPVFQNSHRYGDVIFTLGKALVTQVMAGAGGKKALYQRVEFATDINPMAKVAHGLYRGGFLNAVSVGFIPLAWEPGGAGSNVARRYTSQELLEVSAVSIPANPNALVMGLKSGAVEAADVKEAAELIRAWVGTITKEANGKWQMANGKGEEFRSSEPAAGDTNTRAMGATGNEAQSLFQLAKAFSAALKGT